MSTNTTYDLNKKDFKQMYSLIDDVFNTILVLDEFCKNHNDEYSIINILPIIRFIKNQADKLLCFFIDASIKYEEQPDR